VTGRGDLRRLTDLRELNDGESRDLVASAGGIRTERILGLVP
jgi:hypothetical protein